MTHRHIIQLWGQLCTCEGWTLVHGHLVHCSMSSGLSSPNPCIPFLHPSKGAAACIALWIVTWCQMNALYVVESYRSPAAETELSTWLRISAASLLLSQENSVCRTIALCACTVLFVDTRGTLLHMVLGQRSRSWLRYIQALGKPCLLVRPGQVMCIFDGPGLDMGSASVTGAEEPL